MPKHKAVILYFMYYAEVAAEDPTTAHKDKINLQHFSSTAAYQFIKKIYNVEVGARSIEIYYGQVKDNAQERHIKWDQNAIAQIISSQVKDEETFDEVASFLAKHCDVSSNRPFLIFPFMFADSSLKNEDDFIKGIRRLMWKASCAAAGVHGDPKEQDALRAYWSAIIREKRDRFRIPDPKLEQSTGEDQLGSWCFYPS